MNGDEANAKTNAKLDSFLKKNLDSSVFEQLRYNESCIVVGEKYDKVFSYVVLGHEWIYITENPPKNVKEAVHYKDVTGIQLKNDFPDFLGGQERTNTLHCVVHYKSPIKHKGLIKSLSNKGPRPASPRLMKSASSPDVAMLPTRPQSASPRLDRRRLGDWEDLSDHSGLGSSQESLDSIEGITPRGSRPSSPAPSSRPSSPRPSSRPSSPRPSSRSSSPRPASPRPSSPRVERQDSRNSLESGWDTSPGSLSSPRGSRTSLTSSNQSESDHRQHHHHHQRESVLHLYMLKSNSPIVNHLTNAWNNYLLRATMLCDVEYVLKTVQQRKTPHERLASLFDQLKHEVMLPDISMEDVFSLLNELKTATEKTFLLKKFFWKYGDLFYFTVEYIKRYIPGDASQDSSVERSSRADELELVNLMLEILSLEFRETDVLPQRSHCLRQASGRHLADLVVLCTGAPRLPTPYLVPSRRASELLQQVEADEHRDNINQELSQLAADYIRLSSAVVYELFLLAKQDIYCSGTFLKISWLVQHIKQANHVESFVEAIFSQAMETISPSCREPLKASDALILYQQVYVLKTLLDQCSTVLTLLRTKFMEEFKYYIQGPVLWSKLPSEYPLSKPTIRLLEKIMGRVLQKDVKLSVPDVKIS